MRHPRPRICTRPVLRLWSRVLGRVDVSEVLLSERDRLPEAVEKELETLTGISRDLRRDRELAFYGAEDLTPSEFYSREDAEKARSNARLTVELVKPHI